MKFFKLFENWDGESINEAQKKLTKFDQKLLDLSNGMVGPHSKAARFKNVSNSTPDQFEAFLKQHYKDVKSLPIGKGPGQSGSSKYPGWSITDPDTKITKVVNLASASSAQEKYEDPLVQELNDYFEDGDDSKLSSQSKAIVAQLKKKNKDLTLFKADSKDSNENNFAKNWKSKSKQLGKAATKDPRFSQDSYNPADILVWNLTPSEENSILGNSDLSSLDKALRKYVKAGKVWPISLKAGTNKWAEFNITSPAAENYGKIESIGITPSGIVINQKSPYGLRISNQGTNSVSWEVKIKGSGGQGGKVSKAFWGSNMLNQYKIKQPNKHITAKDIESLGESLGIPVEDRTKGKKISHEEILSSCYDLLLAYQKDNDVYSLVLNLGTKAISPALISNKNPLEQGSPFYKLG